MESVIGWDWYRDPRVLEVEERRLFRPSWQYVGPLAGLARPGDQIVGAWGGFPSWWCAAATASCAASSTSAGTAAAWSSRPTATRPGCAAPTTPGPTAWTGRCGRRRSAARDRGRVAGARPGAGAGGHVRAVRVRQRLAAAARRLRRSPATWPRSSPGSGSTWRAAAAPAVRLRRCRELEDPHRELPGVLPLPGGAPGVLVGDGRGPGQVPADRHRVPAQPPGAGAAATAPGPPTGHRRQRHRGQLPPAAAEREDQHQPRAGRTCPSARSIPTAWTGRPGSSTTTSARMPTRTGSSR